MMPLTMFADKTVASESTVADKLEFTLHSPSDLNDAMIRLRIASDGDELFLYQTYASTRADEMALTGWNHEQQTAFLRMQFEAQRRSYLIQFPQACYWVIEFNGQDAGRLILDRAEKELLLIDIAMLPQFQRKGIGSCLMKALMEEGTQTGKSIRLHVERFNPILPWYERLGFRTITEGAVYLEMVWIPAAINSSKPRETAQCI